jgi:hypothetical protein
MPWIDGGARPFVTQCSIRLDAARGVVDRLVMRTCLAGLIALSTGCTAHGHRDPGVTELSLRDAMQTTADVRPVGLAIAPDGQRFVFDEVAGLVRLDGDRAVTVVPMAQLPDPGPTAALKPPVTDLVALAPGLFALTAIGDGFLLDTSAMTLSQHFCYVPDGLPPDLTQRTDAIAFDGARQRLYAQPITYNESGVFLSSQLASYDRATGDLLEWHITTPDIAATAMVVLPDGDLILAQGARLSRFEVATKNAALLDDLGRFGVLSIDGLAIDLALGTLVVVDGTADAVFDIELSHLAL